MYICQKDKKYFNFGEKKPNFQKIKTKNTGRFELGTCGSVTDSLSTKLCRYTNIPIDTNNFT